MASSTLRNIDLNLLIVFETVYGTGNISHAAAQLSLTQPAVSNALTRLREHFNDPLFVRAGRGVKPTNRSEQMIEPVREALRLIRRQFDGENTLDLASYKRQFRIVVIDTLEPILIPPLLREINARAPHVSVETRPPSQTDVIGEIIAGTLDLACYTSIKSRPGLVIQTISPCDYVIVARRGHPEIGKTLGLKTFLRLGHVALINELRSQISVDQHITAGAGQRRIVYIVNKIWSVPSIVGSSDLLAVLPRAFAELMAPIFGLAVYDAPIRISPQEVHHMVWHERNRDDPGHQWLRETLMSGIAGMPSTGVQPKRSPKSRVMRKN